MISLQAISLQNKNNQLNHFQADSNNLKVLILDFAKEKLIEDTLKISQHNNNLIQGNISLKKPKCLFLAIPFDEGWNLKVNGKDTKIEIAFGGMMAVNLNAGNHLVELTFQDPYIKIGSWISAFSLLILVFLFYFNFKTKTNA